MRRRIRVKCAPGEKRIVIRYYAVPNANKHRGGFLPVIRVNRGPEQGHTYSAGGMDRDVALRVAKQEAHDEASKWRGDYCTEILRSGAVRRR